MGADVLLAALARGAAGVAVRENSRARRPTITRRELEEALARLLDAGASGLTVVDASRLVGVVTERATSSIRRRAPSASPDERRRHRPHTSPATCCRPRSCRSRALPLAALFPFVVARPAWVGVLAASRPRRRARRLARAPLGNAPRRDGRRRDKRSSSSPSPSPSRPTASPCSSCCSLGARDLSDSPSPPSSPCAARPCALHEQRANRWAKAATLAQFAAGCSPSSGALSASPPPPLCCVLGLVAVAATPVARCDAHCA